MLQETRPSFLVYSEAETLDPAQIEQEIEKEGLEVASTADGGAEEEDTALAEIEGNGRTIGE